MIKITSTNDNSAYKFNGSRNVQGQWWSYRRTRALGVRKKHMVNLSCNVSYQPWNSSSFYTFSLSCGHYIWQRGYVRQWRQHSTISPGCSVTESLSLTGNTASSSSDVWTERHQDACIHSGRQPWWNRPLLPMKPAAAGKSGRTSSSLISGFSKSQISKIARMHFTFMAANKSTNWLNLSRTSHSLYHPPQVSTKTWQSFYPYGQS